MKFNLLKTSLFLTASCSALIATTSTAANVDGTRRGQGVSFGKDAVASGYHANAYGNEAEAKGSYANAIGEKAKAIGGYSTAIGDKSETGENGVSVGSEAKSGTNAVAIGNSAKATASNSISLGAESVAKGKDAIAFGTRAKANEVNSLAIGAGAIATSRFSTALGDDAMAAASQTIAVGTLAKANTSASIAIGIDSIAGNISDETLAKRIKNRNTKKRLPSGEYPPNVVEYDENGNIKPDKAIGIGLDAVASGFQSVSLGNGGIAQGENSIVIGTYTYSDANADNGIAIGSHAEAQVTEGVALGAFSIANEKGGKLGYLGEESDKNDKTWVSNTASVSVGSEAYTRTIVNVAAGHNDTDAVNVAQLKKLHDKINSSNTAIDDLHSKIHDNKKEFRAGIAGATAIASIPYISNKKFSYGVALGSYKDAYALGGGIQYKHIKNNKESAVRINFSVDSNKNASVGIGFARGFD